MIKSRSRSRSRSLSESSISLFALSRFQSSDLLDSMAVRGSNRGSQNAGQLGLSPEDHSDVDRVTVLQVETGPQLLGRDDFDDIFSIVRSDRNDHCPLNFSVNDSSITLHCPIGPCLVRKSFYFDEGITVKFPSRTQALFYQPKVQRSREWVES